MKLIDLLIGLLGLAVYAAYHSAIFTFLAFILLVAISGGFNMIGQLL